MKKSLILAITLSIISCGITSTLNLPTYAENTTEVTTTIAKTDWDSEASLLRVNNIGQKILKANNLPDTITFKVSDDESINAYANIEKEVYVFRGLLEYVQSDDELAGVIAHELGHIVNAHCAKQTVINVIASTLKPNTDNAKLNTTIQTAQQLSLLKVSRNDEYEADRTAVDLLVKAGINPLSTISVLNKICGNYFDLLQTHPSGEKRLLSIYDYTNYNYPQIVKAGYKEESYNKALLVINNTLEKRNKSEKKLAKVAKEQSKLKEQKVKRAKRIENSTNPWEQSFAALQLLSNVQ